MRLLSNGIYALFKAIFVIFAVMDYEAVIIGAGAVGLSAALKLKSLFTTLLVVERNDTFGMETSSRNSEVIHAGIYYPKDTLKAILSVSGNRSLYEFCKKYNVNHRKTGKYIIATEEGELPLLEDLFNRAKANGVEGIRLVEKKELNKYEPNVNAVAGLYSPETGIIDSHGLMWTLEKMCKEQSVDFAYKHEITGIDKIANGYKITTSVPNDTAFTITSRYIINSAGLNSDKIAEIAGINTKEAGYSLHFCKGHYFRLSSSKKSLVNHLIYPVVSKNSHGLGIHVTMDLNGELKLGPDTSYLDTNVFDYTVPEALRDKYYNAVSRYLSGFNPDEIRTDQAGIRPKLQGPDDGFRDFIIQEETSRGLDGLINLIGIDSPGLTSCLEIGNKIKEIIKNS